MPNQYTKLTRSNILTKANRRRNPVTSMVQLAREFGYNTAYTRNLDFYGRSNKTDNAAPVAFRNQVKALVGEETYNRICRQQHVNKSYR